MATHPLNLDALIPREDFEVEGDKVAVSSQLATGLKLTELEHDSMAYLALRKPDFQRETASWQPEMVVDLVRSFLDGDLIPSVILWRSPTSGNLFVIDGAHRLSALIAWVQNDYGDAKRSIQFFDNLMPPEQLRAADKCRTLIAKHVGSYQEVKAAIYKPENALPERVIRARNMAAFGIQLQWVVGDALKAESSFFKINQKATPINPVELLMLQSRRKPNAIASRALIRAGVGHKYWSNFPDATQREIEKVAREIYDILFVPVLETPIKTLDLPVAGRGYSADSVKLIFEFVNAANKINLRNKTAIDDLAADADGTATLKYLQTVKRVSQLISGQHASSLGLHPAVYFYGATGRYQPAAFLSVTTFIDELAQHKKLAEFTVARKRFEQLLVQNAQFLNQIVKEYGASSTTSAAMSDLFKGLLTGVAAKLSDAKIIEELKLHPRLKVISEITPEERNLRKNFSAETKSRTFLRDAIAAAPLCAICGARIHVNSITVDHALAKRDGGLGVSTNARLAHPFCNTARDQIEPLMAAFSDRTGDDAAPQRPQPA